MFLPYRVLYIFLLAKVILAFTYQSQKHLVLALNYEPREQQIFMLMSTEIDCA